MRQRNALAPGPVPDHRRRLTAAMVEAVGAEGYAGTTVSRVVELAAVSKATFYEHFRDRDECFAAAYADAVGIVEAGCGLATAAGPEAALAQLLAAASAEPTLARLLLIECHAGPPEVREDHHRLLERREREAMESAGWRLRMPPAALHGGLSAVIVSALLRDGEARPEALLPGLTAWVGCYRPPAGGKFWSDEDWTSLGRQVAARLPGLPLPSEKADAGAPSRRRRLPRGRSAVSPAESAADRRQRLLEATTEVVSLKGYAATTVADVVAAAGVARGVFYSHFGCKLEALLDVLNQNLQESVAASAAQFFLAERWPDRVWDGLEAFLRYFGEHPDAAYLGLVEIYAAGEVAIRRAEQHRSAFLLFLADGYRQSARAANLPSLCSEAVAGAIEGIIRRLLLAGEAHRSLELLPRCAYVALAPFIGSEAALELVVAKSRGARPAPRSTSPRAAAAPVAVGNGRRAGRG